MKQKKKTFDYKTEDEKQVMTYIQARVPTSIKKKVDEILNKQNETNQAFIISACLRLIEEYGD